MISSLLVWCKSKLIALSVVLLFSVFYSIQVYGQCNAAWPTVSGANQTITVDSRVVSSASLTGTLTINPGVTVCVEGNGSIDVSSFINNGTLNHNSTGLFQASNDVINNGVINSTIVGFIKTNSGFSVTNGNGSTFNVNGPVQMAASFFQNGVGASFIVTGVGNYINTNAIVNNYGLIQTDDEFITTNSGTAFTCYTGGVVIADNINLNTSLSTIETNAQLIGVVNITLRGVIVNDGLIDAQTGFLFKTNNSSDPLSNGVNGIIRSFGNMTLEAQITNDGLIEIVNGGVFAKSITTETITNNLSGRIIINGSASMFNARGNFFNSGYFICAGGANRTGSTNTTLTNTSSGYMRVCGDWRRRANLTNDGVIESLSNMIYSGSSSTIIQNNGMGKLHIAGDLRFNCNLINYGRLIVGDTLEHRNTSSTSITIANGGIIRTNNYIHNNGSLIGGNNAANIGFLEICDHSETRNTVNLSGHLDICDMGHTTISPYFDSESPVYPYPIVNISDCGSQATDNTKSFLDSCNNVLISTCSFITLAVELSTFNVRLENRAVMIEWSTASELNNQYFTVLRSKDGINFNEIGFVNGAGNSTSNIDYLFIDDHPLVGINYYRLKNTEIDGTSEFSKIEAINLSSNNLELLVFPNPVSIHQNIYVTLDASDDEFNLTILDIQGKVHYSRKYLSHGINKALTIEEPNLSSGVYYITIQFQDRIIRSKLLVVKR